MEVRKSNNQKSSLAERLTTYIFYASVFIFLVAFNFRDSMTGGWIQQFLPSLPGNPPLLDIAFPDSTIGYAVTDKTGDTSYVLKTTNGGTNWFVNLKRVDGLRSYRLQYLNKDTVYFGAYFSIYKTINGGINWTIISVPAGTFVYDLFVLNKDTIWYTGGNISTGVLYRTTNGGATWNLQYSGASLVDKIYMYNSRIGFMSAGGQFLKTTNSGANWTIITGENDYTDIYFIDSLRGYKAKTEIKKTTNGGLNWQAQYLPNVIGGSYTFRIIDKFSFKNDTIYGVWGQVWYQTGNKYRALVYKTINGGLNWGYQIPDTNYNINILQFSDFLSGKVGWCYKSVANGLITYTGGDTTIMAGINPNSNIVSDKYFLYQNYPNPFNQSTIINVQLQIAKQVRIDIFDITGKQITTLVNKKENSGNHSYKFDGGNLSSGVYFYSLFVDGVRIDTKKMALLK